MSSTFEEVPIAAVREYWDHRPCNLRHSPAPVGTREYFDQVEARKYLVEPHIPGFADFPRWAGKRVLEIGCGLGTDTINFARAGARITAVDLSSRSLELARQRAEVFGFQDRVTFINPGNEVIPGVEAVDTAGHTPGHLSFLIHEDSGPVFVAGDAISNSILSFAHPEWPTASDQDPELGVKTRLALLDRLANEKTQIIGYHFTQPARGIVERKDNAYRLIPT